MYVNLFLEEEYFLEESMCCFLSLTLTEIHLTTLFLLIYRQIFPNKVYATHSCWLADLDFFFFPLPDGMTIPTPKPIIFQLASKINFHTSYANMRMTEMLNIC